LKSKRIKRRPRAWCVKKHGPQISRTSVRSDTMTSQKNNIRPITEGSLLIEETTRLPDQSAQDSHSAGNGWACITNNTAFEKKLTTAGWTFFYMAGTMRARVFGFERQQMIQTAVKRLLARATLQECNCLEIDHIAMRSFWGMPIVTVLAHARHIQQQNSFIGAGA
jgi:hypothetical protein